MLRLSYVVSMMTSAVIVGSLIALVISFGWIGWPALLAAVLLGLVLSWPAARLVSRWIMDEDSSWDISTNHSTDRPDRAGSHQTHA